MFSELKWLRVIFLDFLNYLTTVVIIMNFSTVSFFSDLGRRISSVSGDNRESSYLFQRIAVTTERFLKLCVISWQFPFRRRVWFLVTPAFVFNSLFLTLGNFTTECLKIIIIIIIMLLLVISILLIFILLWANKWWWWCRCYLPPLLLRLLSQRCFTTQYDVHQWVVWQI